MKKYSLIIVLFTFLFSSDKFITPEQSINYVGETETVCGEVVSTHYSTGSRGTPTFLNFDNGNIIYQCIDWTKQMNFIDHLKVGLVSSQFRDWLHNEELN